MNNHTPGPWVAINRKLSGAEIESSDGMCIADAWAFGVGSQAEANARLIAAAPELLDALKDMMSLLELITPFDGPQQRKARAAIEKATGVLTP